MIKLGSGSCAHCTKETKLRCSQCKNVFICSNECNKTFRPIHQQDCVKYIPIVDKGSNQSSEELKKQDIEKLRGKCNNCDKETSLRCGKCKSVFICSSDCMNIFWSSHKVVCKKVREASIALKDASDNVKQKSKDILRENAHKDSFDKSQNHSRPVEMNEEMFEYLIKLGEIEVTIKKKYGIIENFEQGISPFEVKASPTSNNIVNLHSGSLETALEIYKSINKEKQLGLVTDLMELYDSGSEMNKLKDLPTRMLLNRKYNNLHNLANSSLFISQEDKKSFYTILRSRFIGDEFRQYMNCKNK